MIKYRIELDVEQFVIFSHAIAAARAHTKGVIRKLDESIASPEHNDDSLKSMKDLKAIYEKNLKSYEDLFLSVILGNDFISDTSEDDKSKLEEVKDDEVSNDCRNQRTHGSVLVCESRR